MTVLKTTLAVADRLRAEIGPDNDDGPKYRVVTAAEEISGATGDQLPLIAVWPEAETGRDGTVALGSVVVAVTVSAAETGALELLNTMLSAARGAMETRRRAGRGERPQTVWEEGYRLRLEWERGGLVEAEDGRITWADEWSTAGVFA